MRAAASIADKNKIPYLGVAFALLWHPSTGVALSLLAFSEISRPDQRNFCFSRCDDSRRTATAQSGALSRTDGLGKGNGLGLGKALAKKHGYEVVASGEYAPGSKDFSDLILKAKTAGAEAVLALPSPPDGMTIVKQMKELDFNTKVNLFIRAADPPVWSQNLSKDGDYVLLSPGWHFAAKYPRVSRDQRRASKIIQPAGRSSGRSVLRLLADPCRCGHARARRLTAISYATPSPRRK